MKKYHSFIHKQFCLGFSRCKPFYVTSLFIIALSFTDLAYAITNGVPDTSNQFPNVVSIRGVDIRGVTNNPQFLTVGSCSGSLLHIDEEKFVIQTAGHCVEAWLDRFAAGTINTIGVSFDANNRVDGCENLTAACISNAKYYVLGGVGILHPLYHPSESRANKDYGMVVFPRGAMNSVDQKIDDRWGLDALTPITLPPLGYLDDLVNNSRPDNRALTFTAVGYGIGERFPIPKGSNAMTVNLSTFPIRYIADHMAFLSLRPVMLHQSMNYVQGNNGACGGDSGAPHFYRDPVLGLLAVAVGSTGDSVCRASDDSARNDIKEALDFYACAKVPGDVDDVKACVENTFPQ